MVRCRRVKNDQERAGICGIRIRQLIRHPSGLSCGQRSSLIYISLSRCFNPKTVYLTGRLYMCLPAVSLPLPLQTGTEDVLYDKPSTIYLSHWATVHASSQPQCSQSTRAAVGVRGCSSLQPVPDPDPRSPTYSTAVTQDAMCGRAATKPLALQSRRSYGS